MRERKRERERERERETVKPKSNKKGMREKEKIERGKNLGEKRAQID